MTNRRTFQVPDNLEDFVRTCSLVELLLLRHEAKKFDDPVTFDVCNAEVTRRDTPEKPEEDASLF